MKMMMILGAVVLSSTMAFAATPAGTDSITCYSGGTAVFTDAAVNYPVRVGPVRPGDPNDLFTATDTATGATTTIGGPGTVCVVTFTPTTSSTSPTGEHAGVEGSSGSEK